jgi:hypothetical protein
VYVQVAEGSTEAPGRIAKLTPEAVKALEADIVSFFTQYPALLTHLNSPEMLLNYLRNGIWHGWTALDSGGAMEIFGICAWEVHERDAYYHVLYIGGKNLKEHLTAGLKELEKFVHLNSGSSIIFHGRPGWSRLLAPYGYTSMTYLQKNVRKAMGH